MNGCEWTPTSAYGATGYSMHKLRYYQTMKKDRNRVIGGPLDGEAVIMIQELEVTDGNYVVFLREKLVGDQRRKAMHHYVTVSGYVAYVGVTFAPGVNPELEARQAGLILGMVKG